MVPDSVMHTPVHTYNMQPVKPLWSNDARREAPVPLNPQHTAQLSTAMCSGIGKAESVGQILQGNQKLSIAKFHGSTNALLDSDRLPNQTNHLDGDKAGRPTDHFSRHTVTRTSTRSNPGDRKAQLLDNQGKTFCIVK